MFELYQVGTFFVLLLILFIYIAILAWRKKSRTQESTLSTPEPIEFSNAGSAGFYVATTYAGQPLDRIQAHGFGFGGRANILVTARGVEVSRVGEESFIIPFDSFIGIAKTTAVIDKAVERDGLVAVRWLLGGTEVETYFRFTDSRARVIVEKALNDFKGRVS